MLAHWDTCWKSVTIVSSTNDASVTFKAKSAYALCLDEQALASVPLQPQQRAPPLANPIPGLAGSGLPCSSADTHWEFFLVFCLFLAVIYILLRSSVCTIFFWPATKLYQCTIQFQPMSQMCPPAVTVVRNLGYPWKSNCRLVTTIKLVTTIPRTGQQPSVKKLVSGSFW